MTAVRTLAAFFSLCPLCLCGDSNASEKLAVGSKAFTESVILGELVAQLARSTGADVTYHRQLGGSHILWGALQSEAIDIYPEYTGTIRRELLSQLNLPTDDALRQALADRGIVMSRPLGFNNTYAIGMKQEVADRFGIHTISDLRNHPELAFGFSNEVMNRADGWPGLRERYQLPQRDVRGLEHALAYPALQNGAIHATDLYSTDAEIAYYNLTVLKDDLRFFPRYNAVLLYRADLAERAPLALAAMLRLEGRISESAMIAMNQRAMSKDAARVTEDNVAFDFLNDHPYFSQTDFAPPPHESIIDRLLRFTAQHLYLVAISLTAAIVVAVPLGVLAASKPAIGQVLLNIASIIQTIPALALFVFLIPLFGTGGIGARPAILALFLYSLLPIMRNTYAGLHDVPIQIRESARALGLPAAARLRLVELPLAARSILAGIKTSAVINVGTATLGGLIGAGGYGDPIVTGLRSGNISIILEGAIPAAVMALAVQGLFELAERRMIPRGLRLRPAA